MKNRFNPQPKPIRAVNTEEVERLRKSQKVCQVGTRRQYGPCSDIGNDMHHIDTRGSGGPDEEGNLILLCRKHHNMAHNGQIPKDTLRLYVSGRIPELSLWYVEGREPSGT